MISYIRNALSTDYSVQIANKLYERKGPVSAGTILSRFLKFLGFGVIALGVCVSMYFFAKSGAVEQLHTQRLVAFVGFSGLVIFATSIIASFVLLWDTVIAMYARGVAAENALIESAFDDNIQDEQEIEILEENYREPASEDNDEDRGTVGEPIYVRVIPVRREQTADGNQPTKTDNVLVENVGVPKDLVVFVRTKDGRIKQAHKRNAPVSMRVNISSSDWKGLSDNVMTDRLKVVLNALGSEFNINNLPLDEQETLFETLKEFRKISKSYPGIGGSIVRTFLEEGDDEIERRTMKESGMAQ